MSRGSNDPPYGGQPEPNHEEIWEQTGTLDPDWSTEAVGAVDRQSGDVLSDEWGSDTGDDARQGSDPTIETGVHMALDPRLLSDDSGWTTEEQGDGTARDTGEWGGSQQSAEWEPQRLQEDPVERSGAFLGAGWRSDAQDEEEERPRRNKGLLMVAAVTAITATAGGWLLFASLEDTGTDCPAGAQCATVGRADPLPTAVDDAELPEEPLPETATPEETTPVPTQPATPEPSTADPVQTREVRQPSTRETEPKAEPTRSRPSDTTEGDRDLRSPLQLQDGQETEQDTQDTQVTTEQVPQVTEAPEPPPQEERKPGGLLGWLFGR